LFFKSPPALVLASTSAYRRELLGRLYLDFECIAPGVDETRHEGEPALDLAVRLARAKAGAVAARCPDAWVIGSDQVALGLDGSQRQMILGKPGTVARCIEQLLSCSGRTLTYLTAVAVLRHRDGASFEFVDTTRVAFRVLDASAVERYVAKESPLDCAGGFKSEGLGIALCESIDGTDPSALIGLPLIRLSSVLRGIGFEVP
jgi:septum formation protein